MSAVVTKRICRQRDRFACMVVAEIGEEIVVHNVVAVEVVLR